MSSDTLALVLVSLVNAMIVAGATVYSARHSYGPGARSAFDFYKAVRRYGPELAASCLVAALFIVFAGVGLNLLLGIEFTRKFIGFVALTWGGLGFFCVLVFLRGMFSDGACPD